MASQIVDFPILTDIRDVIEKNGGCFGQTRQYSDGKYETAFAMVGKDYQNNFFIVHDGTEKNFLKNLIDSLSQFNGVDYVRAAIDSYSPDDFEEIEHYMECARAIKQDRANFVRELSLCIAKMYLEAY